MTVRFIRFVPAFFADVDAQLHLTRGRSNEPSRADFVEYEVPAIRQALSTGFDELPPLTRDRADYRELVSVGRTVRASRWSPNSCPMARSRSSASRSNLGPMTTTPSTPTWTSDE